MFFKSKKEVKNLIERADRGDDEAEFQLAKRYMGGKGVKQDIIQALNLYEDSAKHGNVSAMLELGNIYFNGIMDLFSDKHINRDYEKSAFYFEKAVENGAEVTDELCLSLGEIYKYGEYGMKEDQKKAVNWYLKPANSGNLDAQNSIVGCYFCLEDYDNALLWAKKAAEQGGADEWGMLGALYHDLHDYENALIWYGKAAEQDDKFALCALGEMYMEGNGVEKDEAKAENFLSKAAELGYEDAKEALKKLKGLKD